MKAFLLLLGLVMGGAHMASATNYRVAHSLPIRAGRLEILEDARLTPATEEKMWSSCVDPGFIFGENSQEAKVFSTNPLLAMKLRQVDEDGKTISETTPEKQSPIGKIETKSLGGNSQPFFLIDTDDDACMGSYSGRGVFLFGLEKGKMTPMTAQEADGKSIQIFLFSSLKSEWRFFKTASGKGWFEQILCRPDFAHETKNNVPFLLRYISFRFDGAHWAKAERQKAGYWESDEPFPLRSDFP